MSKKYTKRVIVTIPVDDLVKAQKLADKECEGNFSMFIRKLLKERIAE